MATTFADKAAQAKQLIEEVKSAKNADGGIKDGIQAEELRKKVDEAHRLMSEAKEEKLADDQKRIEEMLSKYEEGGKKETEPVNPLTKNGPIVEQVDDEKERERTYAQFKGIVRMLVSTKAAESFSSLKFKALAEGTGSTGGFLVPPQYMQDMFAETRRQGNALRRYGWLNEHPVQSNQILLPKGSGAASVGIVAENATKPSADQSYAQVTINIFTWAGISKVSKQLVADSNPTAADFVSRELGTLLGNLEEQKIISGSGTGEPRGILNTTGVGSVTQNTNTAQAIVDAILDAIVNVETNFFAPPNGILMHPRRLAFLQKGKDTQNNYIFNPASSFRSPGGLFPSGGVTSESTGGQYPTAGIFGYPIGLSTNIPTNLGAGTNEDRIIVGDWNEAHWFQREDVELDVSDVAGTAFEANQVWYRLEERAGFSAERYPAAFCVIGGTGLIP